MINRVGKGSNMKFVYGKQDWKTKERGEENCYLLTNGLGGFSSCTMIGSNTRNDHALFMACTKAPNFRVNLIHRLEEVLETDEKRIHLSSQDYLDPDKNEGGSRYLNMFSFEDYPSWKYTADGIEVTKEIAMKQGDNLIAVRYYLENRTEKDAGFVVIPHLQFVPKKEKTAKGADIFNKWKQDQFKWLFGLV